MTSNSENKIKDEKLFLIGTSGSIKKHNKEFLEKKRSEGYSFLAYSYNSIMYLYDIDFKPDYWIFFDPAAYANAIDYLKEKLEWFKNTSFIGYNYVSLEAFYATNAFLNGSSSYGCHDFISNKRLISIYKNYSPEKTLKETFVKNPDVCINFNDSKFNEINCSEKLLKINNFGHELDKLTYWVLPFILNYFSRLKKIKTIGFGTYDSDRYNGGSGSYSDYAKAYLNIIPFYKNIKFNQTLDFDIEPDSFYQELVPILNKNK